ncbi:MAG: glutamate racemase [Anaerolineae bacterium]|nr:glutamate racemase [Anaerolineae bacterium]
MAAEYPPVGIFDSGVGGLSVLRAIRRLIPAQPLVYVADQAHVPYGTREPEEVRIFSEAITRYLLGEGARIIVVACNTASAAALAYLRQTFPQVPFVGMEPAVKPAAIQTRSGKVGVLATPSTLQGALYASVVRRFARGVLIYQDTCPGLVQQIENGNLGGAETRSILENALCPMLKKGVDVIVLGCTHYPFVIPLIAEIVGEDVAIIDPAPAVARQTQRLLEERGWLADGRPLGSVRILTTGDSLALQGLLPRLVGFSGKVEALIWDAKSRQLKSGEIL